MIDCFIKAIVKWSERSLVNEYAVVLYRVFLFLLDRSASARRSSEFLLYFLKIIVTAVVTFDCETSSSRRDIERNAGRASDGALSRRLSVKQVWGLVFCSMARNSKVEFHYVSGPNAATWD